MLAFSEWLQSLFIYIRRKERFDLRDWKGSKERKREREREGEEGIEKDSERGREREERREEKRR